MRFIIMVLAVAICVGCGRDNSSQSTSSETHETQASAAPPPQPHAPTGDPATLPKVPADEAKIVAMLRERFGEATVRNINISVDNPQGSISVAMTGEVPNEEIRQA